MLKVVSGSGKNKLKVYYREPGLSEEFHVGEALNPLMVSLHAVV
jgi:hypothetical protein